MKSPIRRFVAIAALTLAAVVPVAATVPTATAAEIDPADMVPLECDATNYIVTGENNAGSTLWEVDASSIPYTFNEIMSVPMTLNALGYNPVDNFLYALIFDDPDGRTAGTPIRIDANGDYVVLNNPFATPPIPLDSGTFLEDGTWVVGQYENTTSVRFDILTGADTGTVTHDSTTIVNSPVSASDLVNDIAVSPLSPDTVQFTGDNGANTFYEWDPATRPTDLTVRYATTGLPTNTGSQFYTPDGRHVVRSSNTNWYQSDIGSGTYTLISTGPTGANHDGANCPFTPDLYKTVDPTVTTPGSTVTYSFDLINGSAYPIEATLSDTLPTGLTFVDGTFDLGGLTGTPNAYGGTDTVSVDITLEPQTTVTATIDALVDPGYAGPELTVQNQATLTVPETFGGERLSDFPTTATEGDPTPLQIISPQLQVTNADTLDGVGVAGDTIEYEIVVTNTGISPALGVTLSNSLADADDSLSCPTVPVDLAPGESMTCTATHTVTAEEFAAGEVVSVVTATGENERGDAISDLSDDPDDATNADTEGDNEPDDETKTPLAQAPVATDNSKSGSVIGDPTTVTVLDDDTDADGEVNPDSVSLVGGADLTGDGFNDTLYVADEGTWTVNADGTVTFTPEAGFTDSPTPIEYTVVDDDGLVSNAAEISVVYDGVVATTTTIPSAATTTIPAATTTIPATTATTPTTTPSSSAVVVASPTTNAPTTRTLAATGVDAGVLMTLGALLLAAGAAMVMVARRRGRATAAA